MLKKHKHIPKVYNNRGKYLQVVKPKNPVNLTADNTLMIGWRDKSKKEKRFKETEWETYTNDP